MTDKDLAQLQLGVYGQASVIWDFFQAGATDDAIVYGIKTIDGVAVIALRGSACLKDWLRDAMAFTLPITHAKLGPVHPGFAMGMDQAWSDIKARTTGPRVVIGHSLGAARAAILSGLMAVDGQAPKARIVWGEPLSGFKPLAKIIGGIETRSYRNGDAHHHDLVTDVPLSFPPEEYVRASALTEICRPPDSAISADLGIFAWHHMPLYAQATPEVT